MTAGTQHPDASPMPDQSIEERTTATPDERGPHDVPDEKVIETTLPVARPDQTGDGQSGERNRKD